MSEKLLRREFLRKSALTLVGGFLSACGIKSTDTRETMENLPTAEIGESNGSVRVLTPEPIAKIEQTTEPTAIPSPTKVKEMPTPVVEETPEIETKKIELPTGEIIELKEGEILLYLGNKLKVGINNSEELDETDLDLIVRDISDFQENPKRDDYKGIFATSQLHVSSYNQTGQNTMIVMHSSYKNRSRPGSIFLKEVGFGTEIELSDENGCQTKLRCIGRSEPIPFSAYNGLVYEKEMEETIKKAREILKETNYAETENLVVFVTCNPEDKYESQYLLPCIIEKP